MLCCVVLCCVVLCCAMLSLGFVSWVLLNEVICIVRYDEVCQYSFGIDGPQSGTTHFTQIVWKASAELGVGKAEKDENGEKCTFIVARYNPQGNFDTGNKEYVKNVEKGSFDSAYCSTVKKEGLDGGYGFRRVNLVDIMRL